MVATESFNNCFWSICRLILGQM